MELNLAYIMKKIQLFYDKIFLFHYNLLKVKDDQPEITVVVIISIAQSANIFLILTILFYLFNIQDEINVMLFFIVLYLIVLALNFINYVIFKRKEKAIKASIVLPKKFNRIAWTYLIGSLWLPFLLIYILNELVF